MVKDVGDDTAPGLQGGSSVDLSQDVNVAGDVAPTSPAFKPTFSYITIHLDDAPTTESGQDTTISPRKLLYHVVRYAQPT